MTLDVVTCMGVQNSSFSSVLDNSVGAWSTVPASLEGYRDDTV